MKKKDKDMIDAQKKIGAIQELTMRVMEERKNKNLEVSDTHIFLYDAFFTFLFHRVQILSNDELARIPFIVSNAAAGGEDDASKANLAMFMAFLDELDTIAEKYGSESIIPYGAYSIEKHISPEADPPEEAIAIAAEAIAVVFKEIMENTK